MQLRYPRRYRSRHYQHTARGRPLPVAVPLRSQRNPVGARMHKPCSIWPLYIRPETGYGVKVVDGRKLPAHRWVYCKHHGLPYPAIAGKVVMHTCDTPACVEPAHLVLCSQADNMRDMINKGRDNKVRGSKHYAATLDEDVVEYIRTVYIPRCKQYGQSALARRFGVNQSTVSRALKGDTW